MLTKLRERGCATAGAEYLGDGCLPGRQRFAQAIGECRLALGSSLADRLGIAHTALAQAPEHLGWQGGKRLPVRRLLEVLDARGGLQHATGTELLHGFEPVVAAFLKQAGDLKLQLGIGLVELDGQFAVHVNAPRS